MNPDNYPAEPCDIDPSGAGLAPFGRPAKSTPALTPEETAEQAAYQPRHAAPDRHIIPLLWDARKANA